MYKNEQIVWDRKDFVDVKFNNFNDKFVSEKDKLINKVINYLFEDEQRHYEESSNPKDHIYNTLVKLKTLLNKK